MTRRALFATWDGRGQTYLESLFFPIFSAMRDYGWAVDVVQASSAGEAALQLVAASAERHSIQLVSIPTRIGRVGAARGLGELTFALASARRKSEHELIIVRSIVPAIAALAASVPNLVFDADGLASDERIDFAGWSPSGPRYSLFREVERRALLEARTTVTRTLRSKAILTARAGGAVSESSIHVVPNGKSSVAFRPRESVERTQIRAAHGVADGDTWVVYAGSIGPQYHLPEMLAIARQARRLNARVRMSLFTGTPEMVGGSLTSADGAWVEVAAVEPDAISQLLGASDVGLALRSPSFSQAAVSPIKVSEYLLSGLGVVATRGVGDLDAVFEGTRDAISLPALTSSDIEDAAAWVAAQRNGEADRGRIHALGVEHFSLESCARAYAAALDAALEPRG